MYDLKLHRTGYGETFAVNSLCSMDMLGTVKYCLISTKMVRSL